MLKLLILFLLVSACVTIHGLGMMLGLQLAEPCLAAQANTTSACPGCSGFSTYYAFSFLPRDRSIKWLAKGKAIPAIRARSVVI